MMIKMRYNIRTDWLFYLLVLGYVYLVTNMTVQLWFGDGVNIFASYSEPTTLDATILDANKVYWSKTTFLFLTILLYSIGLDCRFVAGLGSVFWSFSLIAMFGPTPTLLAVALVGIGLVLQHLWRQQRDESQQSTLVSAG